MAKYFFNGALLPEIPTEVLESFSYCWMDSSDGVTYSLMVAGYPWYYSSGKMNLGQSAQNRKYTTTFGGESWTLSSTYTDMGNWSVSSPFWSSHDIPNGSLTATEIYLYATKPILESSMQSHSIDFSDEDWKARRPDVFTITEGTTPFFVDSTLPYDSKPTLRSGAISHNSTSETTFTFSLVENGLLELNYTVSSEAKYDWLYIYVDGAEVVKVAGSVSWTIYRKRLSTGEHTVKFKYAKDVSNSSGSDAGAIGYITFYGTAIPYIQRYLIRSNTTFYTVVDNALTALDETELSASLFQSYGISSRPDDALLLVLTDPEVLYWHDSTDPPIALTAVVTGVSPSPQTITTDIIENGHSDIQGIESITMDASDDVLISFSVDDGVTWLIYDSASGWISVEENAGMSANLLNALTYNELMALITNKRFRVRFILSNASYVTSLIIKYRLMEGG